MHAYLNEETNMVEVYNREPDEVLSVEEFQARRIAHERQAKIDALIAQLHELGVTVTITENATSTGEPETEVEETTEQHDTVAVPTDTGIPKVKKRW